VGNFCPLVSRSSITAAAAFKGQKCAKGHSEEPNNKIHRPWDTLDLKNPLLSDSHTFEAVPLQCAGSGLRSVSMVGVRGHNGER
jgi:hypothetical protein